MVSETNPRKKVCVIGAGPAGLVAARELSKEGHDVVVLEQSHDIGGQWLYNPHIEKEHPLGNQRFLKVHSSVYSSLRLASPREVMGFTDFPFSIKEGLGRDTRRFPGHQEVLCYLQDFCQRFKLREMIRFNSRVEHVEMLEYPIAPEALQWVVRSKAEKVVEEVYDAVVVAVGHYSHPRLPKIKGMETWKRKQMHSHVYRVPEPFKNEVVVVVGSSLSGQDVSMEIVNVAREVHMSARSPVSEGFSKIITKHDNLHLHSQIESLQEDGKVLFTDGSWIIADTIIYCTGYSYSFPFLDTKGIVTIDDDRVGPLFEHTFPPLLAPSLSFVGIPRRVIGFPFFESQGKWIAHLLSGKRKLPSQDDMMHSIQRLYDSREAAGIPKYNTHFILDCFAFAAKYADYIDFPHLEEWRKVLCISVARNTAVNLETFRDSFEGDEEMLQVAYDSPHFTEFEH